MVKKKLKGQTIPLRTYQVTICLCLFFFQFAPDSAKKRDRIVSQQLVQLLGGDTPLLENGNDIFK